MKNSTIIFITYVLFGLQLLLHFFIFQYLEIDFQLYYQIYAYFAIILTLVTVVTEFFLKLYNQKLGFVFLALLFIKLIISKFYVNFTPIDKHQNKEQFLFAYLFFILIVTFYYGLKINKTDKKHPQSLPKVS